MNSKNKITTPLMFSNRDLRKLVLPLIAEQVLAAFMGTADTMMVASVGSAAISGVSCVDSINKLVIFLFTALATGGAIICAQYMGRHENERAGDAAGQLLLASFGTSIPLMLLCFVLHKWLLRIIFSAVEESVMVNAIAYFRITAFTYPFIAVFNACGAIYRAGGNSRLPMLISVFSNLLNIAGNALFIFVFEMGAAGAALSTLISQAIAAVIILILLCRPGQEIEIGKLKSLRPDWGMIKLVLKVGIPTGVENAMFQFGKLVVQSTVSMLGTVSIAANAMVVMLEMFTSMPSMAIGLALVTVSGQCVGAGKIDQARYYTKKLTVWSALTLLITNWIIFAATPIVTSLSNMEPAAAQLTFSTMLVISIVKPFTWPMAFTPPNGMRAAGDVRYNMILSSISMWVFRVALTTVLCRHMGVGLIGIWCGYFTDWTVRSICFTIRFHGSKWYSHKVIEKA